MKIQPHSPYFLNDKKEIFNVINKLYKNKIYNIDIDNEPNDEELICGSVITNLCISPNGEIFSCVGLKYSLDAIFDKSISEIWDSKNE